MKYMKMYVLIICLSFIILFNWLTFYSISHKRVKEMNSKWSVRRTSNAEPQSRPWFFKGGTIWPGKSETHPKLYPWEDEGDRFLRQLMYVPPDYKDEEGPLKIILIQTGFDRWFEEMKPGNYKFLECPVKRCFLTEEKSFGPKADIVVFKDRFVEPETPRPEGQLWMMSHMEGPAATSPFPKVDVFNWTATYRFDSTIPKPYYLKWFYYDENVKHKPQKKNYASGKTKRVAWMVSRCHPFNKRDLYAKELAKFIDVDVFGACGKRICLRTDDCTSELSRDYKFYLSFENANCKGYITEKLLETGLSHTMLPIVMGARREDYAKIAPEGSYIHVDDFSSPKDLAEYLLELDDDDELYNSYFTWRGTGEMVPINFWCRLCAMLHGPIPSGFYRNINDWWRGKGVCSSCSSLISPSICA